MAIVNGTTSADTLQGTADADSITPLAGVDIVNALGGDDTINYTTANDAESIGGGEGNDVLNITEADVASNLQLKFYADHDVSDAGVFTAAATSGTSDAIKFNSLASTANQTAFTFQADGTVDITQDFSTSNNQLVIETTGVDKVIFTNGEVDLSNPNEQFLAATAGTVDVNEGWATGALEADADIVSLTNGAFQAARGDEAAAKITAVNGVAVTKDATGIALTGALANYTFDIAGTQTTVQFNAKANLDSEDTGVGVVQTVDVTLTASNGDTFVRKVKVTDAFDNAQADTVSGTAGDDVIDLGLLADHVKASAGNDTLLGGAGDDSLLGGSGNDRLDAGADGATLNGGTGDDVLIGGAGTDVAEYSGGIANGDKITATSIVTAADGTDTLTNAAANLVEGIRAKNLGQSIHGIEMQGRNGTDGAGLAANNVNDQTFATIATLANNDVIGGVTSSSVAGGGSSSIKLGDDLLQYSTTTSKFTTVTTTADIDDWNITGYAFEGTAIVAATKGSTIDTGAGKITFTSLDLEDNVQLTHEANNNASSADVKKDLVIEITNGTEKRHIVVELTLAGDNEKKTGTDAAELLSGGVGNDTFDGAAGNDTLDGGEGDDSLVGGTGDDNFQGGDGNDKITAGDGTDTGNGGDGNDTIDGGKGDDAFFAGTDDNGDDSLVGGEGNDTLGGGEGRDTIDGGVGSNLIFGGDDADVMTLSSGDDSLEGASVGWAGKGNDTVTGGSKDDTIGGGDGNDSITSGDGNDVIYGGKTGDETIDAGKGNDLVYASADRDTITAGDGDDTIFGGAGKDSITGGKGNDQLWGGADNDTIDGGEGDDWIDSAAGNDSLTGGSGKDTFTFKTGDGADTISDFKTADGDVLDLSGFNLTDQNILSYAQEQTVTGSTGIILNLGNNDSIFLASVTLSQIRDANIVWTDDAAS